MQIKKECEAYLNSREVIIILQSNNETFISKVFNCISKHRDFICGNVFTRHPFIATEILLMCIEEAFGDIQTDFKENVLLNRFTASHDNCIPYLITLFRRKYYKLYKQELDRKMVERHGGETLYKTAPGDYQYDRQQKVKELVLQLSDDDQKIYNLRYEQGLKTAEIATILHIKPQTVRDKYVKLHRRFKDIWDPGIKI